VSDLIVTPNTADLGISDGTDDIVVVLPAVDLSVTLQANDAVILAAAADLIVTPITDDLQVGITLEGPPGPAGPATGGDIQDLTILFENGLV
jgi:hypothetical protein